MDKSKACVANEAKLISSRPEKALAKPPIGGHGTMGGRARQRGGDDGPVISLSRAAAIYKEVTGRRKSLKVLADLLHERPHLAVFDFDITSCRPHFLGVRRDRWIYFLKTRYLMYGTREIFHINEL